MLSPGYTADVEGDGMGHPPYPYSSLRALSSQQQRALDGVAQMPLVGFLWKRGASWRSFAYQRRFFYLTEDALCYNKRALPKSKDVGSAPVAAPAEAWGERSRQAMEYSPIAVA